MNALTLTELVTEELAVLGATFDRAPDRPARLTQWCARLPGFGTRCYANGRKAYVVQAAMEGRTRTVTIADSRVITEAHARGIARRVLLRVQTGENPADAKTRSKAMPVFSAFLVRYWANASAGWKASTLDRNRYYRTHLVTAFPRRHLDAITPGDVRKWFAKVTRTAGPAAGNRSFELMLSLFRKAEEWGELPSGSNPCHGIKRNRLRKHECLLSAEELTRLGQALDLEAETCPKEVAALRLIILTGCRKSEICNLTWDEVRGRRLLLHDAKTGPRTVWLGKEAQAILDGIEHHPMHDEVFWTEGGQLNINQLDGCYYRVRRAAGLDHVRLHDLRHNFASHAASMSETLPMIAKLLGHADIKMAARYAHLDDASVLEACEAIGAALRMVLV
ncbi:tyrosine-type recombinase/integrase [Novosphingobium humi]|uniref:Site-specific integrase n=1 Tax=Novosphingobium humi TaxID=2282397 RepID=A0ABY7U169_9SPHN|nr:site-specific integrase [Novosphingobium humi]WCT79258.1 site-specific integrase [Novosphingobium humi]